MISSLLLMSFDSKPVGDSSSSTSDVVAEPTFEETLTTNYYNLEGEKYDPNAPPAVYLIDKVLPGGKRGRKPFAMSTYLRYDSIPDVISFNFVDKEQGGGYFKFGGEKYDGVELLDVPAEEVKNVTYKHPYGRESFDPATLPVVSEVQKKTIIRADGSSESEDIEVQFTENPYNPSAELKLNNGVHNEIQISTVNENGESNLASATLISRGNWRSSVDVDDQSLSGSARLIDYVQFRDYDGDKMKSIIIKDGNPDPDSGYFVKGRKRFQGKQLRLRSRSLRRVKYIPGDILQPDELTFTASDGIATGVPTTVVWGREENIQPEVKISDQLLKFNDGSPIPLSSLLRVRDKNKGDEHIFSLSDVNEDSSSGQFLKDGRDVSNDDLQRLSISELSNISWKPGQPGVTDEISVSVSDGLSEVEKSTTFSTRQTSKPELTLADLNVRPELARKPLSVSHLISDFSQNKDLIKSFTFDLGGKNGYFLFNGKKVTERSKPLTVEADLLDEVQFVPGAPGKAVPVTVTASDGVKNSKQVTASWGTQSTREDLKNRQSDVASIISSSGTIELLKKLDPKLPGLPQGFSKTDKALDDINTTKDVSTVKVKPGSKFSQISSNLLSLGALAPSKTKGLGSSLLNSSKGISKRDGDHFDFSWVNLIPLFDEDANPTARDLLREPWFVENLLAGYSTTVEGLGIDRTWGLGDFLGIPNSNSWDIFLGPDLSMDPVRGNPSIGGGRFCGPWPLDDLCGRWPEIGASYNTGDNKLKAGLDINAEYSLGQLDIKAGGLVDVNYTPLTGIWVTPRFENPSLELTLPYAKLKLDAMYDIRFNPSLSAYAKYAGPFNFRTGNLLSPLNFNVSDTHNFIDIDTRRHTGASLTQEFDLASFSAQLSLPEFGDFRRQDQEGRALRENREWSEATGPSITWGLDDNAQLMDFSLSLGELATSFGIPLVLDDDWGPVNYRLALADAILSLNANLDYNITLSMKPNIYATVEGSDQRYDVVSGFNVFSDTYRDVNRDGFVEIDMVVDPVIGYNIDTAIRGNLNAEFSALEMSVGVPSFDFNQGFGPLIGPARLDIGSPSKTLFDDSGVLFLSEVVSDEFMRNNLMETVRVPIA
jgi:hypothetical protein